MKLTFKRANPAKSVGNKKNTVYLNSSNWDDYSFKTTFEVTLYDSLGGKHDLGQVKIGYIGQAHSSTEKKMDESFEKLPENFFSLGQSVDFYRRVCNLPKELKENILVVLRDVVHDGSMLLKAKDEPVFKDSLLRGINLSSITTQFKRVLSGGAELTDFHFSFKTEPTEVRVGFDLTFDVVPDKKPSQNIHVLIGRNGIGKTTLLNEMITSLVEQEAKTIRTGQFFDTTKNSKPIHIDKGYFAGVVSVSFSAFDPFIPPPESNDDYIEPKYSYIGLKHRSDSKVVSEGTHKDLGSLSAEFVESLVGCFGLSSKRDRWFQAIEFLESDQNFADMNLNRLLQIEDQIKLKESAKRMFREKMSSGHAIVLLTITKLVERSEEKTLVIMDEPESHLHPPLLSAFIRALADLLTKINGVAIIATHSPVVLQEVPQKCVWKLYRSKLASESRRPEIETFGENVGVLTREVFSLEVDKSGFYDLLSKSVAKGKGYEDILEEYDDQLGFEGRAILRALVTNREKISDVS